MSEHLFDIIISSILGALAWLWVWKDRKRAEEIKDDKLTAEKGRNELKKEIDLLFKLHHNDEKELNNLALEIAKNHYPKNELDVRFQQLDSTLKEGFHSLSDDVKEMTKALMQHMSDEHNHRGKS